ncbi:MAG: hypothetical protein VB144_08035 [Clostridia bacterium]|nr:hypothetical protein [Clostridia bacterium]
MELGEFLSFFDARKSDESPRMTLDMAIIVGNAHIPSGGRIQAAPKPTRRRQRHEEHGAAVFLKQRIPALRDPPENLNRNVVPTRLQHPCAFSF